MSDLNEEYITEKEYSDTLSTVQRESCEWRARAYPETRSIELQALGVCEEAGELAHAVLKYKQGIRGYDREKTREEVADAIGDIMIYACGVADQLDIDISRAVYEAWEHVRDRNITQGSNPGNLGPSRVGCFSPAAGFETPFEEE
jgi:NTP pyrophosphatase (non-canonical NTP hydrolase)